MFNFTLNQSDSPVVLSPVPTAIQITYGRPGTWYEDAKGMTFEVLDAKIYPGEGIPELVVSLGGYLDGEFGLHPTKAIVQSESDYKLIY